LPDFKFPDSSPGVDNVIELNIVTSTGKYLTANSYTNPELVLGAPWWGGGTYGIVTSATYRTHPSLPLTAVFKPTQPTAVNLLTEFIRIQPSLSDAGFSGYALIGPNDLMILHCAQCDSSTS